MVNNILKAKLKPSCTGFIPSMIGSFWVSLMVLYGIVCMCVCIYGATAVATVMEW